MFLTSLFVIFKFWCLTRGNKLSGLSIHYKKAIACGDFAKVTSVE